MPDLADKKNDSNIEVEETQKDSSQTSTDDDIIYPTGIKLIVIITALCLAVFLVALDQTIIATAIPRITDHFNSVQDIGWYGSVSFLAFPSDPPYHEPASNCHHQAYFLTATSLQPSFGRIYKTFSVSCRYHYWAILIWVQVKGTFLAAIGIFELGSVICGAAPSSTALIVGRAIAGIGVGGIFSGALVITAYCRTCPLSPSDVSTRLLTDYD
jgi:MFS family permease